MSFQQSSFLLIAVAGVLACVRSVSADPVGASPTTQPYKVIQQTPDRLLVRLPNQLLVIVQEVRTAPVVSAQVWIKTGSIYEQEFVGAGLSHYLEHLLCANTTSTRSEEENKKVLGEIGAEMNAMTGMDNVHYYINTTRPFAAQAVDQLSDWMQHSQIPEKEFEREQTVIQREFDMGEGEPGRIFWKLTQAARFRAHPARHPTIGYRDEFDKITREQVIDFYHRMYVPNNMLFVVVGDVDKQKIVDQIAGLWKDAKPSNLPKLSFPVEPEISKPQFATGTANLKMPRLRLAWPSTQLGDEGDYALDLLAVILGQGEASRLVRSIRDEQGLVSTISSYNLSFHWGKGYFGIDAELSSTAGSTDAVSQAILKEVAKVRGDGITADELARAKRQIMAQVVFSAQTAEGLAERLGSDLIATGDPDYLERYSAAIQKVTVEQVKAAANRFLTDQRLITLTLTPRPKDAKTVPLARPEEDPEAGKFKRVDVVIDNSTLESRIEKAVAAGGITARSGKPQPVERFTLPNGLRVIIGRNSQLPSVAIELYQLGGLLADKPGEEGIASAAAGMLMRGTKNRTAEQIAGQIEDLGAGLTTGSGNNTWFAHGECLHDDWGKVLELLADVTLNPSFPEDEWAKMKPRVVASIDRIQDTWVGELRSVFLKAYFHDHPWSVSPAGRPAVIDSAKAEDLRKFHFDHLDAHNAVLAIFGDVDPAAVKKEVTRLFAAMPGKPKIAFAPREPAPVVEQVVQQQTAKQLSAVQIGYGPGLKRPNPDFPRMQVLARILSSFPSGWLDRELRGTGKGLVYAVSAGQLSGYVPGYFTILFNTQSETLVEATQKAMDQVRRIRSEPVTEADLARAKSAVLTGEFMNKQSNSDRATEAAINELYGLGDRESENFLKTVQDVDAKQINEVAKKYLRVPVVVVITNKPLPDDQVKQLTEPQPAAGAGPKDRH